MARNKIAVCLLVAMATMLLSSCKRELLMVWTNNYTDYDCALEISSGDDWFEIQSEKKTYRSDLLKRECSYDSITVWLMVDGEYKDMKRGHRFEQITGERITTEKGGCMTQIEILPDEHGEPYLSIGTNYSEPSMDIPLKAAVDSQSP